MYFFLESLNFYSNGWKINVPSFSKKIFQLYKAKNAGIALAITRLFNAVDWKILKS